MKKKELTQRIEEILECQKNLQEKLDAIYDIFGSGTDKFEDVCWKSFDLSVRYLEELVDDKHGIIGFFIFDCQGGKEPQSIKINDKYTKPVNSIKTVLKLLEQYK